MNYVLGVLLILHTIAIALQLEEHYLSRRSDYMIFGVISIVVTLISALYLMNILT